MPKDQGWGGGGHWSSAHLVVHLDVQMSSDWSLGEHQAGRPTCVCFTVLSEQNVRSEKSGTKI